MILEKGFLGVFKNFYLGVVVVCDSKTTAHPHIKIVGSINQISKYLPSYPSRGTPVMSEDSHNFDN